jgi:HK97 family phage major capsid protein
MDVPILDNAAGTAGAVAENGIATFSDVGFDHAAIPAASKFTSRSMKASIELVQDSTYPFEDVMLQTFSGDFARSIGAYLVTILAAQAVSGVSAGASTITVANVYDLIDSVDAGYLASRKCAWAMSKATFIAICKLNSANAFPTFPITGNARDGFELLSFPVRFCPSVAAIGTGNKSVYFGDFSRLVVRRVQSATRSHLINTSGG